MTPEKFTFGEFVRKMREDRGWTQLQLIERSGISPGTVSALENDETNPKRDTLDRLAKAFEMTRAAFEMAYETYAHVAAPVDNVVQMPALKRVEDLGISPVELELAKEIHRLSPPARHAIEGVLMAFKQYETRHTEK